MFRSSQKKSPPVRASSRRQTQLNPQAASADAVESNPLPPPAPKIVRNDPGLIELNQVKKTYPTASGDFLALNDISLNIYPGEFIGVIGKSGAGKSTLLNMITGVDSITSGEVTVRTIPGGRSVSDGRSLSTSAVSIHKMHQSDLALWRGRNLGIIYQSFQLLPMLTLVDNIILPMDLCGLYRSSESREKAFELLKMVELEDHAHKLPAYISGGQQQRVAIARALANDPPIIVADEPTGSLDSNTAETIFEIFEKLIERGKTIVMVTHDNSLGPRFTRRVVIADGAITGIYGNPPPLPLSGQIPV
jgi:putative ABC transport system ATP-binding protein